MEPELRDVTEAGAVAHYDQQREEAISLLRRSKGAFFLVCDVPLEQPVEGVFATHAATTAVLTPAMAVYFYGDVHRRAAAQELSYARALASHVTRQIEEERSGGQA